MIMLHIGAFLSWLFASSSLRSCWLQGRYSSLAKLATFWIDLLSAASSLSSATVFFLSKLLMTCGATCVFVRT